MEFIPSQRCIYFPHDIEINRYWKTYYTSELDILELSSEKNGICLGIRYWYKENYMYFYMNPRDIYMEYYSIVLSSEIFNHNFIRF